MTMVKQKKFLLSALSVLIILSCQGNAPGPDEETRVLFIGNSYTFVNDLPNVFANIAYADDLDAQVGMTAPGGYTLDKHAKSEETLKAIKDQSWDFVVLQEQSVIPSIEERRLDSMYPSVRFLNQEIRRNNAQSVLYMTWGRRRGLPDQGFPDFESMQNNLEEGYMGIAQELDLIVAPVGIAWKHAIDNNPELDLWSEDGSHPNLKGTYLTACVFYSVIFQKSPEGLGYYAGLDETTGKFLQSVAKGTVLQNKERWFLK